jgi:hypothetical protein
MARPSKDLLDRFSPLQTSELALAQQATSRFWPAHQSESIGPEVYSLAMNRALLGDIALTFVRCSAGIRATLLEPCREACLILPLAGSVEITKDSGTYRALPGHPLFPAAGRIERFEATAVPPRKDCCDASEKRRSPNTSRMAWAKLLARVGEKLSLECPACGSGIRFVTFMTEPETIRKIVVHLREAVEPPPISPARGPPNAWCKLAQVRDDRAIFPFSHPMHRVTREL